MRSFRPNISLPGLLVFFIALLLGLGFALFPWMSDDLWYRLPFKDFILHGAPFDTDTLLREIRKHHLTDNSRLANVAMALLQFLPGWFTASLSALAAFATMSLMRRYGAFAADTAATALFCGLFALVMPWIDQMYVFDFQLNYLWAGMLMALLLYLLAQGRCAPDALFLTGLLTGVWQECTAFPLFVALLASAALYRRCRTHRCGAAVLGLLLGLMWLYFSPGGSVYRSASWTPFGFRLGILAVFVVPVAVYTAMLLPSLWRRLPAFASLHPAGYGLELGGGADAHHYGTAHGLGVGARLDHRHHHACGAPSPKHCHPRGAMLRAGAGKPRHSVLCVPTRAASLQQCHKALSDPRHRHCLCRHIAA
ncbi:MAG: hypothetical protein K2L75_03440 [Muribaculaceae bacterium]|nr:hypothetical protein [Muribaculaceae bacterium]